MTTITATVVADSITVSGERLTTFLLSYPRFIHAELMTHRMFSRNASSSRAIPVKSIIKETLRNTASPIHWGANQPGMQANSELRGWKLRAAKATWWTLSRLNVAGARVFTRLGAHKQFANRVLEPYSNINVLVTATEYDNFFNLRIHSAAQPEIRKLAEAMRNARLFSDPYLLKEGQWHMPFVDIDDRLNGNEADLLKISAARCARLSYTPFGEPNKNRAKDVALAEMLWRDQHLSPFEHQATPKSGWHANFNGWQSFRNSEGH